MARSARSLHRAKFKPYSLILGPVVTNDWCINWIRPRIYSEPCRNRRDSKTFYINLQGFDHLSWALFRVLTIKMAHSAGHLHRAKLKPRYLILGPVVTNDWCTSWICPRIYSEPCRNRRDSPFAACSPSTDTPNVTGEKSTWSSRNWNPGSPQERASTRTSELPSHTVDP